MAFNMYLSSQEILEKYIAYFKERGHVEIPNVSLVPENDPTLLFVNSGMFPLVPYLMGQPHPMGTRLVNVQRCVRFEDMEEVGDNCHTTAFHMMGNWSLNNYFKKEQLPWIYGFLFDELGINPQKVYSTVFAGNAVAPRDRESLGLLKQIFEDAGVVFEENKRVFFREKENWWQRGDAVGELGGPDSEIFYYIGADENYGGSLNLVENDADFLEIGNSVFMQYVKTANGWEQISNQNVDFGGGLERMALVVQGKTDIFETDNFWPIIQRIEELTGHNYKENPEITRHMRIIADHIRSAVFIGMDGVGPSNKDQGYILRRLLRRIVRSGKSLGFDGDISVNLVGIVAQMFGWLYPILGEKQKGLEELFSQEEQKFRKTLAKASREVAKYLETVSKEVLEDSLMSRKVSVDILAQKAFDFYQSLGYPEETFIEDLREYGVKFDPAVLSVKIKELVDSHKEQSRLGAEEKFKGGLADSSEQTIKFHTATHLLHASLISILGDEVSQAGSNITAERLRFDFSFSKLLTDTELRQVEDRVNSLIGQNLSVKFEILDKEEALKTGALHFFGEKYGDKVKIYYVGDSLENAVSKEFCGGPHVNSTGELDPISIYKQKKIGQKIVRVYAKPLSRGSFAIS